MQHTQLSMKTNNIEYLDDVHAYLIDGVLVPSVSELIRFKFPEAYSGIPQKILKAKANYGSRVHDYIQRFVEGEFTLEELQKKNIDPNIKIAVEQFEQLRKRWAFYIKDMEQIIHYKNKFAGRYDLCTEDNLIIDIKTTAELHEDWLALQLGLYQLGAGITSGIAYCFWLPKGKPGKVVTINPWTHNECLELLEEYEKHIANK